jgi:murein DD-endopeptidase MepM/ murein hydrolase activator NlpD
MSTVAYSESKRINHVRNLAAVGLVALLAGCSTASDRFGPFESDQASNDPGHLSVTRDEIYTGSAGQSSTDDAAYSTAVQAQPLTSPSSTVPAQPAVQNASFRPGNGEVTVNHGDTLYSISRAHNVAVGDLIAINNLQPPYRIQAGQRLQLPGTTTAQQAAYTPPASAAQNTTTTAAQATTHTVRAGETLYSISRSYGHSAQNMASYNNITDPSQLRSGLVLRVPPRGWTSSNQTASVQTQQSTTTNTATEVITPATARADQEPAQVPANTTQTTPTTDSVEQAAVEPEMPARTSSRFRWPVRGRIISEFGTKPDGSRNDGINLAVPEGTSVKAAENGVVAYAGNELQGYGNLILIRHADNWVTAYAHASEIFVRRGDVVSRGQIIAKAGQSGNVTTPQLHFEVRQGAQAVDPQQHLAPNTVAGE